VTFTLAAADELHEDAIYRCVKLGKSKPSLPFQRCSPNKYRLQKRARDSLDVVKTCSLTGFANLRANTEFETVTKAKIRNAISQAKSYLVKVPCLKKRYDWDIPGTL
jgi:hypothetical protein